MGMGSEYPSLLGTEQQRELSQLARDISKMAKKVADGKIDKMQVEVSDLMELSAAAGLLIEAVKYSLGRQ